MLRSISKQSRESVKSVLKKKRKAFLTFQSEISPFLQLLVHTYGKHANNFCNFAYLKFHLVGGVTIGYFRCIQFLRKAMEIKSDASGLP